MMIEFDKFSKLKEKIIYVLDNFDSAGWDKGVKEEFAHKIIMQVENILNDDK